MPFQFWRRPGEEPTPARPAPRAPDYEREWEDIFNYYEKHPPWVEDLDLSAAGGKTIPFKGNEFAILYIAGTNPVVTVRFGPGGKRYNLQQETVLTLPFREVFLSWGAIVGGVATVQLARQPWG